MSPKGEEFVKGGDESACYQQLAVFESKAKGNGEVSRRPLETWLAAAHTATSTTGRNQSVGQSPR